MIKELYNEFKARRDRILNDENAMVQDVIEYNIDLLDSNLYSYKDILNYLYIPMED